MKFLRLLPFVVTALVERSAVRMAQVFGDAVQHQHGTTTPLLLQRAIRAMCVYVEQNPAAVALCLTGGADGLQGVVMGPLLGRFEFDLTGRTAACYSLAVLLVRR